MCTRILAIDGGGIRGLAPALILAHIEELTGKPIAQLFGVIAGTSTGAILALGLTRPSEEDAALPAFRARDIVALYEQHGETVFPGSSSWYGGLKRLIRPRYSAAGAREVLTRYFGDVRLVEALTTVLVPVYDIERGERIWFDSFKTWSRDVLMADLVTGAISAPTYLPPTRFIVPDQVKAKHVVVSAVDGALFANNPAVEAVALADRLTRWDGTHTDNSVFMLSIGTGGAARGYQFEDAWRWGLIDWAAPLLEVAFNDPGIEKAASAIVSARGVYQRLKVTTDVRLDDASSDGIERLKQATSRLIQDEQHRLRDIATQLTSPRPERCGPRLGANYVRPLGPRKP